MEKPQRKLWRKIGLQKNFLQGTSHSDQSKNTFSQQQFSHIRTESQHSHKLSTDHQVIKQCQQHSQIDSKNLPKQASKEPFADRDSLQSPIDRLDLQSFEEKYMVWAKQPDRIDNIKQSGHNQNNQRDDHSHPYYFQSINTKYLDDVSVKHSIMLLSDNQGKNSQQVSFLNAKKTPLSQIQRQNALFRNSVQEIKIRLNSSERRKKGEKKEKILPDKLLQKSRNDIKSSEIDYVECEQMFTITPKEYQVYQKNEKQLIILKLHKLPKLLKMIKQSHKQYRQNTNQIKKSLKQYRNQFSEYLKSNLSQQIQQFTDQIGYLYSQNQELMDKMNEKQLIIKKLLQQIKSFQIKLQNSALKSDDSLQRLLQQKAGIITRQQNEINSLYEKMQDFEQVQNKSQKLSKRISQLQRLIISKDEKQSQLLTQIKQHELIEKQHELTVNRHLKSLDQKSKLSQQLSKNILFKQQKIKQQEGQINLLYIKIQEIQYKIRKQFQQQFIQQENQFSKQLKQQKIYFQNQREIIKNTSIQMVSQQFQQVMEELIKQINILQIQNIVKKFNVEKNQYMNKVFQKVNQYKLEQKSESVFNIKHQQSMHPSVKSNRFNTNQNNQTGKISPKSDSDQSSSLNKNFSLRKTGFFGSVSKPNLQMRLDDIQTKFAQITEIEEDIPEHRVTFDANSSSERRKYNALTNRDNYSQISNQSGNRQDYMHRPRTSSIYSKQEDKKNEYSRQIEDFTREFHRRQQSQVSKNSSSMNYSGLNSSKNKTKTESPYQFDNDNSFTNSIGYRQFNNTNQNPNYSFNEMHCNNTESFQDKRNSAYFEKAQTQKNFPNNQYQTSRDKNKVNTQRNDIVEKIKERLKNKFKTRETYQSNQPSYRVQHNNNQNKRLYRESQYTSSRPSTLINRDEMILADFYDKHSSSNSNTIILSNNMNKMPTRNSSPHSISRSPSNTRSRSPSNNSITQRNPPNTYRPTSNNYNKINKTTGNVISTAFSKSVIERPQFVAQTRKPPVVTGYQPKSSLYAINKGQTLGSAGSYLKKF